MKKSLLIPVLLCSMFSYSQDKYSFGYKDGFTKGCNCYDNPPSSDYIFRKGGYDKGYYDGQIDGRLYKLENTKTETYKNPYENIPMHKPTASPYLQQGMVQMQQLINERRLQMTNLHNEIFTIASSKTVTEAQRGQWEEYKTKVNLYFNQDLSNSTFYNSVISWMYQWRDYVKTWL